MANDGIPFALTLGLTLLGLGIMLYGVLLNHGEAFNGPMIAGGGVLLLGVGVLTAWIVSIDDRPPESGDHA